MDDGGTGQGSTADNVIDEFNHPRHCSKAISNKSFRLIRQKADKSSGGGQVSAVSPHFEIASNSVLHNQLRLVIPKLSVSNFRNDKIKNNYTAFN
jgi:hypothetical protein